MNKVTHRQECSTSRAGFSLIELISVLVLLGIMTGIAATGYTRYLERSVPDRASRVVGSYVSLARSYAIQRRSEVTLVVLPEHLRLEIRSSEEGLIRTLSFDEDSDLPLGTLDTNIDGDRLTFNARGVCSVCGISGNGITVTAGSTTYLITFNALGRWKRTLQ